MMTTLAGTALTILVGGAQIDRQAVAADLSGRCACEVRIVDAGEDEPDYYVTVLERGMPGYQGRLLGRSRLGTRFVIVQLTAIRELSGYSSVFESRAVAGVIWHELVHLMRNSQGHDRDGLMAAQPAWAALISTRAVLP